MHTRYSSALMHSCIHVPATDDAISPQWAVYVHAILRFTGTVIVLEHHIAVLPRKISSPLPHCPSISHLYIISQVCYSSTLEFLHMYLSVEPSASASN